EFILLFQGLKGLEAVNCRVKKGVQLFLEFGAHCAARSEIDAGKGINFRLTIELLRIQRVFQVIEMVRSRLLFDCGDFIVGLKTPTIIPC
ncbi:MAG: hypothetical protein D3916_12390, partial [Candidatus Electrothrix sp. MAN1_4]|nr:hypothetical protein [Candidatus Electrothrix sp. MAN1_4]